MRAIKGIDLEECSKCLECGEVLTGKRAAAVIASLYSEAIGGRYCQRTLFNRVGLHTAYEVVLRKQFGSETPVFRSAGDQVVSKKARSGIDKVVNE